MVNDQPLAGGYFVLSSVLEGIVRDEQVREEAEEGRVEARRSENFRGSYAGWYLSFSNHLSR